jgi:ring-1,2-phenylacetyl-CoA epoxidase subunit PaaD
MTPDVATPDMATPDVASADVATADAETLARAIADVPDPEVPVVTIEDLGILRDVAVDEAARRVRVTITPTYSGCPAMDAIATRIVHEATKAGYACDVVSQLSPAWTTDWMTERGHERLREFGIAPPSGLAGAPAVGADGTRRTVALTLQRRLVTCPLCGSAETEELSRFGSTACKALRRCLACREPFDEFKVL